jgi:hypothetical protein
MEITILTDSLCFGGNPGTISLLYPFYHGLLLIQRKLFAFGMSVPCSLSAAIIMVRRSVSTDTMSSRNMF